MSYLAFARKYRPENFSQVIGQEGVVKRLKESIASGRIHHAFLFSGPRGVGKTSLARILAKALNCLEFDTPTVSPCGKCASCRQIQQGSSLDVIEIDGASNRGIDEIRQLRENVKFSPALSRFKVYIIDEVHQITQDAFNALLKTLEEPPAHVKFIFATTNPNKVPVTILSRCLRFNFGLLSEDKIIEKLHHIAKNEEIKVDEKILKHISHAALGSIRDAESIFDQITPLIVKGTTLEQILDILGQIPEYQITSFVSHLLSKNASEALTIINHIIEEGQDLNNFISSVIEYLRNIMLAKLGENVLNQVSTLPEELCKKIGEFSKLASMSYLISIVDSFIEAKKFSRYLPSVRIPLEVAVVRLTFKDKIEKETSQPEEKTLPNPQPPKKQFGFQHKTASLNLENISKFTDSFRKSIRQKIKPTPEGKLKAEQPSELDFDEVKRVWPEVLKEISKKRMAVATYLNEAHLQDAKNVVVTIGISKNLSFNKEFLEKKENKQLVEELLAGKIDKKLRIQYIFIDKVGQERRNNTSKDAVNKIIDAFDGQVLT